ncbi:MAG: DUF167 domain-containing protein [Legionella sp.]|uniref:DUF167 domain-containing protein n=1 Tax=Legionella sp. TaxID=459 RepID=UPI0039E694D1
MWFKIQDQQITLQIIVKPNAKKTAIIKITDHEVHFAVHAKPHKGEANKELILFLSKVFEIPKSTIVLKAGTCSKYKQVIMPLTTTTQKILNDISAHGTGKNSSLP